MERDFLAVRCLKCRRVLYEIEREALQPGRAVRKICDRCGQVNTQVGKPAEHSEATSA